MTVHLSVIELELVVCGDATPEHHAHVAACAQCGESVRALRADQSLVGTSPYERAFEAAVARAKPSSRRRVTLVGLGLALAAAVAVFVRPTPEPTSRIKGTPTLSLLDAQDEPATAPRPNDRITMVVSGVTEAHLAVYAIEGDGQVASVWPTSGPAELRPPSGRLPVEFEVTEGSVELIVLLGDDAFPIASGREWLVAARAGGALTADSLRIAVPATMRWASAALVVRGSE